MIGGLESFTVKLLNSAHPSFRSRGFVPGRPKQLLRNIIVPFHPAHHSVCVDASFLSKPSRFNIVISPQKRSTRAHDVSIRDGYGSAFTPEKSSHDRDDKATRQAINPTSAAFFFIAATISGLSYTNTSRETGQSFKSLYQFENGKGVGTEFHSKLT